MRTLVILFFSLILLLLTLNAVPLLWSRPYIYDQVDQVPATDSGLILGAGLTPDGEPSNALRDRLDTALRLYRGKKVRRLILSGDGTGRWYNEVRAMQKYLLSRGVDQKDLVLDPHGTKTFESMRTIKQMNTGSLIIFSQRFHLPRAVFLARAMGIDAVGVVSDQRVYVDHRWYFWRELFARPLAIYQRLSHLIRCELVHAWVEL